MVTRFQFFAAFAVGFLPIVASADLATVHLTDGKTVTVELVTVERGQIQWRNPANSASKIESYLRSQIEYVDFPPTGLWKSAEADFESGDFPAAIEGYESVIADRSSHFYPIPGNFVSLALVRILDIKRFQLDSKGVANQFKKVRAEWTNLPPDYRKIDPVTAAWIALSEEKWQGVLDALAAVESPSPEMFYLRGRAAEALGKSDEAIQHYAGAYVLNFGGFAEVTKQSLRRSIDLLAAGNDKNRRAELQAQARLYRDLFGKGKLWAGIPEWVAELAGAEIEIAKADIDKTEMESPAAEGGTVVEAGAASATLPPKDERDWVLASEIDRKIYVTSKPDAEIENLGGVTKSPEGFFDFEGTGGGLKITGVDGRSKLWIVKAIFTPREKDGALFDISDGKGRGIGSYLKEGKLVVIWKPLRGKATTVNVGEVTVGKPNSFYFSGNFNGDLRFRVGEDEVTKAGVEKGGLKLGASLVVNIGDTTGGGNSTISVGGNSPTPFKGSIEYFALGYGENGQELLDAERSQFDGKQVRMYPKIDEPSSGDAESEAKKPDVDANVTESTEPEKKPEPVKPVEKPAEKAKE